MREKMICYKRDKRIIYFSDLSGRNHFVPEGKWKAYLRLRQRQPKMVMLFSSIADAREATLTFADDMEKQKPTFEMATPSSNYPTLKQYYGGDHLNDIDLHRNMDVIHGTISGRVKT